MRNTKKILFHLLLAGLTTIGLGSCSKEEGKGGKAAIHGYVYYVINNGDIVSDGMGGWKFDLDTIPAIDKTTFIVYGGGTGEYDDKTSTNAFGYFKFDYLREGDYMLYAVVDSADQKSAVFRNVKIGKSGTNFVEPFFLNNGKNSKCSGMIGSVRALYSNEDEYVNGVGIRVYIKNAKGGDQNDTRSDKDGLFRFSRLQPNTAYEVWAETEDRKNYAVTAKGYTIVTGAEGTVVNMTSAPIDIKVY